MARYWWITAVLGIICLFVMPFDLQFSNPDNFDYLPGDLTRVVTLSETFAHGYGILIVAVGIWLLAVNKRRFIPRILMCAIWPAAGVNLIKLLFGRHRPIDYLDNHASGILPQNIADTWLGLLPNGQWNTLYATQAFPSAHAATVWGLAIGMSWVFPKGKWLFYGIAVLASIQRVTSAAHWTTDVLVGIAIAFVMAGSVTENWGFGYFFGRFENRTKDQLSVQDSDDLRRTA